ncbi:glycosyltransferase family 2 protein [Neolewinella litorea]|uniref:Glycosyltransferase n=1 Tax=Neolewinella litorea TaxID=2562452 RepID=A0A4S4NIX0_9BACT|nr:glycosyltransferase [Neolewinella litorea]THH39724.1 glycosyltransferase [Neolewinella litorea]
MRTPPKSPYHLPPEPQNWRQSDWPEVSVSVVTYNQHNLIGRALDSILAQQVNFSWEIVVGDDCSTDGTREILLDYQSRYPDIIRLLLYDHRLPGTPGRRNNMLNPMACRGRYTALLDGDDYWVDPNKLQRQYDTMERYPELSISLHDTRCEEVNERGELLEPPLLRSHSSRTPRRATGFYPHEHFCADRNIRVHTSSFFFRTRIFGNWPPDMEEVVAADHYFFLLISQRGPAYYEDRVASVNERQPCSLTNSDHYLSEERKLRHLQDMRLYRTRFPATRLTDSYSAFAARLAKEVLFSAIRSGRLHRIPFLLAYLAGEPRGLRRMVRRRLEKASFR